MHTREYDGFFFNFNSDLSGNVEIGTNERNFLSVPGSVLLQFLSEWKREQLSDGETELSRPISDQEIAIVCTKGKWFVRRICASFHDLDKDQKIYICDLPLGGPFGELQQVPQVQTLIDRACKEYYIEQRELDDMP